MVNKNKDSFYRFFDRILSLDTKYYFKSGSYIMIAFILSIVFAFVMNISLTYFLQQEAFGEFQFFLSVIALISIFSLPGMRIAIARSVSRGYERSFIYATKTKLSWSLIGSAILFVISGYFYYVINSSSWAYYAIGAVLFPFVYGLSDWFGIFTGREEFDKTAKWSIYSNVFIFIGTATVALTGNLLYVVVFFLVSTSICNIIPTLLLRKTLNSKIDKKTLVHGKHLSVLHSLLIISQYIDKIIVTYFFGFVKLAIYAIATLIPNQLKSSIRVLSNVLVPRLSKENKGEILKGLKKRLWIAVLLSIGVSIIGIVTMPIIMPILFSVNYIESILLAQILFISKVFVFPSEIILVYFQSQKEYKYLHIFNIASFVIRVLLLILFIILFGLLGAIIGIVLSEIFNFAILFMLLYKKG